MVIGGIMYTEYLKRVPLLGYKNFYTSLFWSMVVFLIPLSYKSENFLPYILIAFFVFLKLLVNTIFFDIKDIKTDQEKKLKTFPVLWGKTTTLSILHLVNVLSLSPLLLGVNYQILPDVSLSLITTNIFPLYYLTYSYFVNEKSLRLVSYTLVDGEYIFWPLIVFIGKIIV
jgi:4-hydroxybenzoate polyprenyltransferase